MHPFIRAMSWPLLAVCRTHAHTSANYVAHPSKFVPHQCKFIPAFGWRCAGGWRRACTSSLYHIIQTCIRTHARTHAHTHTPKTTHIQTHT